MMSLEEPSKTLRIALLVGGSVTIPPLRYVFELSEEASFGT